MHENQIFFDFLRQLIANNNREWFKANRKLYDAAWKQFNTFVADLIAEVAKFDPEVANLQPSDCTYRIYRDMRFTQDKTPYKGHFGAYICKYGKKSWWGGYYTQIEPHQIMLAGGVWYLPPKDMAQLRHAIADQMETYERIVENEEFKRYFPHVGQERFKRIPNGLPKDTPHPEYLMCKDYTTLCVLKPEDILGKNAAKKIAGIFKVMQPLNEFLSENIIINMEERETMKNVVKFF